jgi:hypothetical protein
MALSEQVKLQAILEKLQLDTLLYIFLNMVRQLTSILANMKTHQLSTLLSINKRATILVIWFIISIKVLLGE